MQGLLAPLDVGVAPAIEFDIGVVPSEEGDVGVAPMGEVDIDVAPTEEVDGVDVEELSPSAVTGVEVSAVWKWSEGPRTSTLILEGSKGHIPALLKDCLILKGVQVLSNGSVNTREKSLLASVKSWRANVSDFRAVPVLL